MMKHTKTLIFLSLMMLALNACAPVIANASGTEPEPVVEAQPVVVEENEPASVGGVETNGYTLLSVHDVTVEVGPASAVTANVVINFDLPDSCAQLEYVRMIQDGAVFFITLGTTPSNAEGCIQDTLPQRASVPLHLTDLPIGNYEVDVNGTRAGFSVTESESTGSLRTKEMPNYMDDATISELSIVNGVGSPLPIHIVLTAELPRTCGQLGEMRINRDGNTFFVRLIAEIPAQTECNNDKLPVRVEIPMNIAGLIEGSYQVNVNGTVTSFDLPVR